MLYFIYYQPVIYIYIIIYIFIYIYTYIYITSVTSAYISLKLSRLVDSCIFSLPSEKTCHDMSRCWESSHERWRKIRISRRLVDHYASHVTLCADAEKKAPWWSWCDGCQWCHDANGNACFISAGSQCVITWISPVMLGVCWPSWRSMALLRSFQSQHITVPSVASHLPPAVPRFRLLFLLNLLMFLLCFFVPPLFFLLFSCNLCCVLLIFLRARMLSTSAYQSDGEILLCDMHRGDAESLMFTSGSQRFLKRCSGFVRNCLDATSSAE